MYLPFSCAKIYMGDIKKDKKDEYVQKNKNYKS